MAAKKSGEKVDRREAKPPSERQKKVVKARAEGKTYKESGIVAGYPAKNAAQSAYHWKGDVNRENLLRENVVIGKVPRAVVQ